MSTEDIELSATSPLCEDDTLQNTGLSEREDENMAKDEEEKKRGYTLSYFVFLISGASILLQIFAMWIEASAVVYVMGVVGIIISPIVILRQVRLNKLETVRMVHNKLRQEVNRLQEENDALQGQVHDLQVEVDKVDDLERQLGAIAKDQGANVKDLVEAVKENGIILKEQAKCAKAAFEEQLFTTVLRTDRNRDMRIEGREADILILRLKNQEGITLNEEKFRDRLEKESSVATLMKIVYDLEKEGQGDDAILKVNMEEIVESQRIASS